MSDILDISKKDHIKFTIGILSTEKKFHKLRLRKVKRHIKQLQHSYTESETRLEEINDILKMYNKKLKSLKRDEKNEN